MERKRDRDVVGGARRTAAPLADSSFPRSELLSVCLLVPDRYNCLDGRASHHGIDFEPSADLMQALAHARQPDALRGAVLSTDQLTHAADDRHALARILACDHDTIPAPSPLAHETVLRRGTV